MNWRHWIAWQLEKLSARIFDAEYREEIIIKDDTGVTVFTVGVYGDAYGNGWSHIHNLLPQRLDL